MSDVMKEFENKLRNNFVRYFKKYFDKIQFSDYKNHLFMMHLSKTIDNKIFLYVDLKMTLLPNQNEINLRNTYIEARKKISDYDLFFEKYKKEYSDTRYLKITELINYSKEIIEDCIKELDRHCIDKLNDLLRINYKYEFEGFK